MTHTMSKLAAVLALVALLAPAGCANGPPPPKKTTDVRLADDHRSMEGTIYLGDGLRVVLPPSASPDTQWVLVGNETRVLRQLTHLESAPDRSATITFQARHLGRSVVRFAALNPNQNESGPSDVFQIAVEVTEP
jgi:hypothetical protein